MSKDNIVIKSTQELIAEKYYWLTFQADTEHYMKRYDACLA